MPDWVEKTLHVSGAVMGILKPLVRRAVNGRRGAFQALFAVSYLALGLSYVLLPSSPGRAVALAWIPDVVPLNLLGFIWLIAGVFGLWGATRARPADEWSFIALTLAPTVWGFLYLGAVVFGTSPQGWVTSVLYWCIAGAVMVVSGMTGDNDRDERKTRVVRP
jgi:hypothetical protein